jgi:glycosyltransferase involved in cell wall biosynthesis
VAKVFLRTLHNEPFGISIVEAMAAGCVPVVPRDGGPWLDILEQHQGKYGFSYATLEEAADHIRTLLQNEQLRTEISKRAQERAMNFESSLFEERFQEIVQKVLKAKSKDIRST